jgi:hypothetical protein
MNGLPVDGSTDLFLNCARYQRPSMPTPLLYLYKVLVTRYGVRIRSTEQKVGFYLYSKCMGSLCDGSIICTIGPLRVALMHFGSQSRSLLVTTLPLTLPLTLHLDSLGSFTTKGGYYLYSCHSVQ